MDNQLTQIIIIVLLVLVITSDFVLASINGRVKKIKKALKARGNK